MIRRGISAGRIIHRGTSLSGGILTVFLLFLMLSIVHPTSIALAQCTTVQITDTTGGDVWVVIQANSWPTTNSDGTLVAFSSNRDLTGNNPDENREIFLFDAVAGAFTQITDTTGGDNTHPAITPDGARIAFRSDRDLTGGNSEGNFEIFLFDVAGESFTQISNASIADSDTTPPSISADGALISFQSNGNLVGGNDDLNWELFIYDTVASALTQLAVTRIPTLFTIAPYPQSMSADGSLIAFQSFMDLVAGENVDANSEIYLIDTDSKIITQITHTTGGDNFKPSISSDGSRIAFTSTCDLTGNNADGGFEIFFADTTTPPVFTQVTDTPAATINDDASINSDGSLIALESHGDLTGGNADENREIFLFDTTASAFTQITDSTDGLNLFPAISPDGTRIAFVSNRNLTGGNPDGNSEIFLYSPLFSCTPEEQIENLLDSFDYWVEDESLVGSGPGASATNRLETLRNMLDTAGKLIEKGNPRGACQLLENAYDRTDGASRPPDFTSGDMSDELASMILDLMNIMGCE